MGDALQVLIIIGSVSYTATEVLKAAIRIFFPRARVGIIISAIFNLLFIYGLGQGILGKMGLVDYTTTAIPELFKHMDLITTAFALCLVNKGIDKFFDLKKIANVHLFNLDEDKKKGITKDNRKEDNVDVTPVFPREEKKPSPSEEVKPLADHEVVIDEDFESIPINNENVEEINEDPDPWLAMENVKTYSRQSEEVTATSDEDYYVSQMGMSSDPYDDFDEYEDDFALSHMGGNVEVDLERE